MRKTVLITLTAALHVAASASILNVNLLVNPGFENNLTGWVTDHGTIRTGNPAPHGGAQYLSGATDGSATSYTRQTIDLIGLGFDAGLLDSGTLDVHFGGYQSGWETQRDSGKIEVIFSDGGTELGRSDTGWFYSNHTWVLRDLTVDLPTGTRVITYGFYTQRYEGYNTDGYLDDAFAMIVPEPASLACLAFGACWMLRRKRF